MIDPRTGDRCPVDSLSWPVALGHIFETDVRAFAISVPVPVDEEVDRDDNLLERFLRTLTEALRLSAARLLNADGRDIAATFQINYGRPTIVLYDRVAGGAGYVRRFCEEGDLSAGKLFSATAARLNCPNECASSCAACLNDYANQRHWEDFDRRPVLGWLHKVLKEGPDATGIAPAHASHWESPSLDALSERLRGSTRVDILAPSVLGATDANEALTVARFLRRLHEGNEDRRIRLFISDDKPVSLIEAHGADLGAVEILAQLELDGILAVFKLDSDTTRGCSLPRLSAKIAGGLTAFYSDEPHRPLLEALLPGEIFETPVLDGAEAAAVMETLNKCPRVKNALSGVLAMTHIWEFLAGQERDLSEPFAILSSAKSIELEIRDPYLLAGERNKTLFVAFLRKLADTDARPSSVKLMWREDNPHYARAGQPVESTGDQRVALLKLLKGAGLKGIDIVFRPQKHRAGFHFHDRRIMASLKRDGQVIKYRWDLSSGVDNLMDSTKECVVFGTLIT